MSKVVELMENIQPNIGWVSILREDMHQQNRLVEKAFVLLSAFIQEYDSYLIFKTVDKYEQLCSIVKQYIHSISAYLFIV